MPPFRLCLDYVWTLEKAFFPILMMEFRKSAARECIFMFRLFRRIHRKETVGKELGKGGFRNYTSIKNYTGLFDPPIIG